MIEQSKWRKLNRERLP